MNQGILVLAMLLAPLAGAEPISLEVPAQLSLHEGFLMSGHVEGLPGMVNPVFANPAAATFGSGTLTACPVEQTSDVVDQIVSLGQDCDNAESFVDPEISFGAGTMLQFVGDFDAPTDQEAVHALFDGGNHWAVLTADKISLAAPEGFGFAPITSRSAVIVTTGEETRTFERDAWVFFHDSANSVWTVEGYGATGTPSDLTLSPADSKAFHRLGDPFVLLDLQGAMLGTEFRDTRADAAHIFYEFGRIPDVINGAIYGNLTGTIGDIEFTAGDITAVRFETAQFTLSGTELTGEGVPVLVIHPDGIGTGGRLWSPAWWLAIVFWTIALAVAFVRRYPNEISVRRKLLVLGGSILGFMVMDLWVFWRLAGTGAIPSIFRGDHFPVIMDMFGIVIVSFVASWFAFMVPIRFIGRKLLPTKWGWILDSAIVLAFAVVLLVSPAAFLSGAYDLVRF